LHFWKKLARQTVGPKAPLKSGDLKCAEFLGLEIGVTQEIRLPSSQQVLIIEAIEQP